MSHRYALAAVLVAALSVPAAAQQTTQPDTSKKSSTGTTTTTSNGAVDPGAPAASAAPNPNGPSATPGSTLSTPASSTTTPSSAAPSTGTVTTTPAPTSGNASSTPSGVTSAPSDASTSGASTSGTSTTGTTNSDASASGASASGANAATGQVQPTSGVAKVQVKVAPSLANTVKISADSAFALARASNTAGEISSAELEMTDHRLVYQVKMVKGAGASTVYVDAMTGEVVKDKKFGGLKAAAENQEESKKLYDAKKDSSAAKKP
jgi:uncharacterized membrane protein YkoI